MIISITRIRASSTCTRPAPPGPDQMDADPTQLAASLGRRRLNRGGPRRALSHERVGPADLEAALRPAWWTDPRGHRGRRPVVPGGALPVRVAGHRRLRGRGKRHRPARRPGRRARTNGWSRPLRRMHADLARAHPAWDDRIEVVYCSRQGLASCRTDTARIAVISSGAPFQVVEAGGDWVLTWYPAREDGVRLLGPPVDVLIPPIPCAEFLQARSEGPLPGWPTGSPPTRRPGRRRTPSSRPAAPCTRSGSASAAPSGRRRRRGASCPHRAELVGRAPRLAPTAAGPRAAGRLGDRRRDALVRGRGRTAGARMTPVRGP